MSDADDDDVGDRPASKRARGEKMSKLIDDIAEDEDDPDADDDDYDDDQPDEEDDTGDFIANDADAAPSSTSPSHRAKGKARMPRGADIDEDDTMHLSLDQLREQRDAERLVADLESRYGGGGW